MPCGIFGALDQVKIISNVLQEHPVGITAYFKASAFGPGKEHNDYPKKNCQSE